MLKSAYEKLLDEVLIYERASGIKIAHGWDLAAYGKAVALVKRLVTAEYQIENPIAHAARSLENVAKELRAVAADIKSFQEGGPQ